MNVQPVPVTTQPVHLTADERNKLMDQWRPFALMLAGQYWRYSPFQARLRERGYEREDLLQVVLAAMWQATGIFDLARGFSFGTLAKLHCLHSVLRLAGKNSKRLPRLAFLGEMLPDVAGKDSAAEGPDRELLALVASRLRHFPPKTQDAMRRRYFLGQKFREIAAAHGVSKGAVRQRIERALQGLRRWLSERQAA